MEELQQEPESFDAQPPEQTPSGLARWTAAIILIVYGFAKLNDSQFTVLESELTRPMGEVSGFWLTWYYFGYSSVYGNSIALLQVAAGILLLVPRTALLGALVVAPMALNLVAINILYGIALSAMVVAMVLLVCALVVIAPYVDRLRAAVLLQTLPVRPATKSLVATAVLVVGAVIFTWWTANHVSRFPTEIDGVWRVVEQEEAAPGDQMWRQVFFERNRAYLAVFRAEGDTDPDARRHFEVDDEGVIRVWEVWLSKGEMLMEGRRSGEDLIELRRTDPDGGGGGGLVLQRVSDAR